MILLVVELGDANISVQQEIAVGSTNLLIRSVRPHLYVHNAPSGSLAVEIRESGGSLRATSETLTIAAIKTGFSSLDFDHGYVRFNFEEGVGLAASTNYLVRLISSGGYTFSEASYVGWCKDFDLRKVDADYAPNSGYNSALDVELWQRARVVRNERT